jgi:hypothetical protein
MNELKLEDVMKALDKLKYGGHSCHDCKYAKWSGEDRCGLNGCRIAKAALALLREKDAEIERLTQERDDARRDCAIAEQNHYECKKELEEMSDDILDNVRAERDRYKAESQQYQSAFLKATMDAEQERFQCKNICEPTYKNLLETARSDAITEFAERLKKFYSHLKGNTASGSVEYHIDQVVKEMKGGDRNE